MDHESLRTPAKRHIEAIAQDQGLSITNWYDNPSIPVNRGNTDKNYRECPDIIGEAWPIGESSKTQSSCLFIIELKNTRTKDRHKGTGFKKAIGQAQLYTWALWEHGEFVHRGMSHDILGDRDQAKLIPVIAHNGVRKYQEEFVDHLNNEVYSAQYELLVLPVSPDDAAR